MLPPVRAIDVVCVAAGSVVVHPVPGNVTVAGVPAKVIGEAGCAEPSRTMDQLLSDAGLPRESPLPKKRKQEPGNADGQTVKIGAKKQRVLAGPDRP